MKKRRAECDEEGEKKVRNMQISFEPDSEIWIQVWEMWTQARGRWWRSLK